MMEFRENMTAYENGDMNATMSADNILGILIAMDDEGLFDYHDDHHDDHHDGSSMTLGYFDVSSWDSTNDLQAIVDWFNDEYYYHDDEERLTVDDFLDMCGADPEYVDSDVAQCVLDQAMSMLDYDHHDDHHDGVYWSQWNYCEWEGDSSLQDGDMRWYCTDNDDGTNGFEDWWYYCEAHDDGMDGTTYFCTDDFGQSADYENSASNDYYVTGGSPNGGHGDHDDHGDHGDHDDHGDHGDHDDNDNQDTPALLNGIIGIEDPDNAGDDCNPSVDDPHLMGNVDDNEGHPLTCTFEFKIHFDGVDESLDTHVAFIPFQAQDDWTLTLKNALGYEVTSCDNCEMSDDGVMTGIGPVNLTIGKVVPQPDCDYIVGLSADGMAFDPVKLAISAGETVCWQWKDAAMAHNVVEIEGEYDSSSDLTGINFGFNSGDPAMTVDFRHTFTEDNRVHYYVCAPHAQLGMVGQVTVGNGTDDPVQQVIEDEEVPSIGFVLGSLVLVGAAGLRRRIH